MRWLTDWIQFTVKSGIVYELYRSGLILAMVMYDGYGKAV
jgi:hypothetical protein